MTAGARGCHAIKARGAPFGATPRRVSKFCVWHDPPTKEDEARRLGGYRRRRESVIATTYEFEGLESVPKIRRLIEVAVTDTLSLENSMSRNRTLAYLGQTALKALEAGEFEQRLPAVEARIGGERGAA